MEEILHTGTSGENYNMSCLRGNIISCSVMIIPYNNYNIYAHVPSFSRRFVVLPCLMSGIIMSVTLHFMARLCLALHVKHTETYSDEEPWSDNLDHPEKKLNSKVRIGLNL